MRPGPVHQQAARTVITRTRIIDGTAGPDYMGDIVLEDGRISDILSPGGFQDDGATVIVDGMGLVACPGFIDMQGASGLVPLMDPARHCALTQGVTTEVVGRDKPDCAPLTDGSAELLLREFTGLVPKGAAPGIPWRSVGQYLDRIDERTGTNIAYLVPQETLRTLAEAGPAIEPAAGQLVAEVKALADALEQGAFGLSSPVSDSIATTEGSTELEALCTAVAAYRGYWAPFTLAPGAPSPAAVALCLDLAAKTGVQLHLSHLAADEQDVPELLNLLDQALGSGLGFSCDSHPYLERPGTLAALLPDWARAGRPGDVMARLEDAETISRIRAELEEAGTIDWASISIASVSSGRLAILVGQDIARVAALQSSDPITTMVRILRTDSLSTTIVQRTGTEEGLRRIMSHGSHTGAGVGSGSVNAQHPGAWGAFARFVGHEVREAGVMDLPSMIHQLSGRPAALLNLPDRGVLSVGNAADVLVFDADAIIDMATFADPRQPAAGIIHVFVNGVPAVSERLPTSALAGRALRRGPEGTTKNP